MTPLHNRRVHPCGQGLRRSPRGRHAIRQCADLPRCPAPSGSSLCSPCGAVQEIPRQWLLKLQAGPQMDTLRFPSRGPCVDLEQTPVPSLHDSIVAQRRWMMRTGDAYWTRFVTPRPSMTSCMDPRSLTVMTSWTMLARPRVPSMKAQDCKSRKFPVTI